jgi:rSAM/selenodomain-associated transferase 1
MIRGAERSLHLGVMAKFWATGRVKTRLGDSIGMRNAAELHRVFCRHLATQLADAADVRSFVIAPAVRRREFSQWLPSGWRIEVQSDGDLGRRMRTWFGGATSGGETPTERVSVADLDLRGDRVLIGADCPTLQADAIDRAGKLLRDHDLVLGPTKDGGYYLIGLRGGWRCEYASLMEKMAWSSDSVFESTCHRAEKAGLSLATLPTMEDIDTVAELDRLRKQLERGAADPSHGSLRTAIDHVLRGGVES